ncbi:MAG: nickel-dependent lactate racemase [Thermoleophilia bacterium]
MPAPLTSVEIPYGSSSLSAEVPGPLLFSGELEELPEVADLEAALLAQLESPIGTPPLRELAAGRTNVVVLVEDATRHTPVDRILPVLFDELNRAGVSDEHIEILTAPGTHRILTDDELRAKIGERSIGRVRVSQHDCLDLASLADLEPVHAGGVEIPVQVNRRILEADLLIGLGNILPHCGAGFSGGAKILQPGVCGVATTSATHIAATLLPEIPLGDMDSPVRVGIEEVARRAGLSFIINVVRDPKGRVVTVVAGDFVAAHRQGVEVSRRAYAVELPALADIVVVSSFPADIDWWQGEKGLIAASFAVRQGGVIVLATPCPEGLEHNHPLLRDWLALTYAEGCARIRTLDPADVSADLISADLGVDNAKIREKATILVVTDGLEDDDIELLGYEKVPTLQAGVDRALELIPGGTIGLLPYGGDCLPLIAPRL